MKNRHLLMLAAGLGLFASQAAGQYDPARAEANYTAVLRGEKTLAGLSPAELQEVAELDRLVRAHDRRPRLSAKERCRLAQLRESPAPTELELRLVDLKCSQR